ncbi:MAG: hypothetical protein RLN79_02690 [Cytophagales bacterium]
MKYISIIFLLFFVNCKKEENSISPQTNEPVFAIPTSEDSYWIYEWYSVYDDSIEIKRNEVDTINIIGDTTIRGQVYTILDFSYFGNTSIKYRRDSSGYLINQNGIVEFEYLLSDDTLNTGFEDFVGYWYTKMSADTSTIELTSGNYNCIELEKFFYDPSITPFTTCGQEYYKTSKFYCSGIGEVLEKTGYYYNLKNCELNLERRLIEYNITEN